MNVNTGYSVLIHERRGQAVWQLLPRENVSFSWATNYQGVQACHRGLLMVTVASMQQEEWPRDCGLFSIDFAYHEVLMEKLLSLSSNSWEYILINCLQAGKLSNFHKENPENMKREAKHATCSPVSIVFAKSKNHNYGDKMIQCEKCSTCFYFKCASNIFSTTGLLVL